MRRVSVSGPSRSMGALIDIERRAPCLPASSSGGRWRRVPRRGQVGRPDESATREWRRSRARPGNTAPSCGRGRIPRQGNASAPSTRRSSADGGTRVMLPPISHHRKVALRHSACWRTEKQAACQSCRPRADPHKGAIVTGPRRPSSGGRRPRASTRHRASVDLLGHRGLSVIKRVGPDPSPCRRGAWLL